jgi:hypothetical protein
MAGTLTTCKTFIIIYMNPILYKTIHKISKLFSPKKYERVGIPTASTRRNMTWLVPSPCQDAWTYSTKDSTTNKEP